MLGRGLESLIPKKDLSNQSGVPQNLSAPPSQPLNLPPIQIPKIESIKSSPIPADPVFHIEVEKIKSNPHQPRKVFNEENLKDLAASIREFGVIQPIIVSKVLKENPQGTQIEYQLIAGERRLMASRIVGLPTIPAIIRRVTEDKENLEIAIIENLQRTDLNAIESARAYAKLQEIFGLTQREIAVRLSKSREAIANTMRLLNLPVHIQDAISSNSVTESQGRLILSVSNPHDQEKLFNGIMKSGGRRSSARVKTSHVVDPEWISIKSQLEELLGTKVKLQKTVNGGKLVIDFYSPEELDGILNKLGKKEEF